MTKLQQKPRVLIVEDEVKIASVLRDYLEADNYTTHHLPDGHNVVTWVSNHRVDLVLLDVMLPGENGLDICREIRSASDVPIIMVTARVDDIDRLLGLELGADDYICKPFNPREVVARVKAILRRVHRSNQASNNDSGHYRDLVIDDDRFAAFVGGRPVDLTPVEFRMLQLMGRHPGRVYSRDQLQTAIYSDGRVVSDRTVDTHVKNLRKKLRPVFNGEDVIHSIYSVGYKFE